MQYETVLGLRREHTFDEARQYIQRDPDKIKCPRRDALFLQASHIYGQVKAIMRNYGQDAQREEARYRAFDEQAPYVPPKPKPPRPNPRPNPETGTRDRTRRPKPRANPRPNPRLAETRTQD